MMFFVILAQGTDVVETGHLVGIGGILIGVLTAATLVLVAWLGNARRTQHEIGQLHVRVSELTTRVFGLIDEGAACKKREADLKMEVHSLSIQMRLLQMKEGLEPPTPIPGIIVADIKGKILAYSPSLVPMLGWLPNEMERQSIEVLVPPDLMQQHRVAFARYAAMPNPPTERDLITYALAKSGSRVPVTIHLKSLQPEGLVTAEIRQRAEAKGPEKS